MAFGVWDKQGVEDGFFDLDLDFGYDMIYDLILGAPGFDFYTNLTMRFQKKHKVRLKFVVVEPQCALETLSVFLILVKRETRKSDIDLIVDELDAPSLFSR